MHAGRRALRKKQPPDGPGAQKSRVNVSLLIGSKLMSWLRMEPYCLRYILLATIFVRMYAHLAPL